MRTKAPEGLTNVPLPLPLGSSIGFLAPTEKLLTSLRKFIVDFVPVVCTSAQSFQGTVSFFFMLLLSTHV